MNYFIYNMTYGEELDHLVHLDQSTGCVRMNWKERIFIAVLLDWPYMALIGHASFSQAIEPVSLKVCPGSFFCVQVGWT